MATLAPAGGGQQARRLHRSGLRLRARPPCLGLTSSWVLRSLTYVNDYTTSRSGRGGCQVGGATCRSAKGVCEEAHVSVTRR
eukprot:3020518-Rhodomonas_salina.1